MAISEYRKIQMEERALKEKLDEIAEKRARQLREKRKMSYAMHTPKEALKRLGERSRKRH